MPQFSPRTVVVAASLSAAAGLGLWSLAALPTPALAQETAGAFDPAAMTDDQREAFRAEVRAYLLENPEVIMEAVQQLESRQAQAQADADMQLVADNLEAIANDGYSWVGGNPEGDVTVVEFMDYRCGYCRKAFEEVNALIESDGNIRFVVKEFPILGEASVVSSRFAIAAKHVGGDEAYEQVHDALMTLNGNPDEATLTRLGDGLGLDTAAIMAAMDSDAVAEEIASTRALAQTLAINGTPTFVIGDQMIRGYVPKDAMEAIVADVREE